jgi:hypothetical protein
MLGTMTVLVDGGITCEFTKVGKVWQDKEKWELFWWFELGKNLQLEVLLVSVPIFILSLVHNGASWLTLLNNISINLLFMRCFLSDSLLEIVHKITSDHTSLQKKSG